MKELLIFLLLTVMVATLVWKYARQQRTILTGRAQLLDRCSALLQQPQVSASEAGYARLQGQYRGYRVDMSLVEDHLTMRKLPSLWLQLLVEGVPINGAGTLGVLARPQNTEFYSACWDWIVAVDPLPGWPAHALYRSYASPPDLNLADPHVRGLFSDDKAKELVLTPRRVRVTYQAKQAERGDYLLLRTANFDHDPLSPELVQSLLERAIGLRQALEGVSPA